MGVITSKSEDSVALVLKGENCGQSPARFFCVKKVAAWVVLLGEESGIFRHASPASQNQLLLPGLKAGGEKIISINLDLHPAEVARFAEWKRLNKRVIINVSGIFTWKTPFGEDSQPFTFSQMGAGNKGNFIYDMITEDHVEAMWQMAQSSEPNQKDNQ